MVWVDHANNLEDAKKKFFDAREAYQKAKEAPLTNPNYCQDLKDAEEKMKLQYKELEDWKNRPKSGNPNFLEQLQKNALIHPDPKIRAISQVAIESFVGEILASKPQSFRDAVQVITELKLFKMGHLTESWEQLEEKITDLKDRALILVRKAILDLCDQCKAEDPEFKLTPAYEVAMVEKILNEIPGLKDMLLEKKS